MLLPPCWSAATVTAELAGANHGDSISPGGLAGRKTARGGGQRHAGRLDRRIGAGDRADGQPPSRRRARSPGALLGRIWPEDRRVAYSRPARRREGARRLV